jgi:hypothetical protein
VYISKIGIGIRNLKEATKPIPVAARVCLVVNHADAAYWLVAVGRVGLIYKGLVHFPIAGIDKSWNL